MFGLYITHPQVKMDPDIPVPRWGLSETGANRAAQAARLPWVRSIRRIVSSDETKAIETAEIFAQAAGIGFEVAEGLHENDRSATGFLPPDAFERAADTFFAQPNDSFRGWERAIDAQARIVDAVSRILADHDKSLPIAFIGHGAVGTLLKCHMDGQPVSRIHDQPAGGGNLYCFSLAERAISCDWTRMEHWQGV